MKSGILLIFLLIFTFMPVFTIFAADDTILESAKKAGFEQPAEGNCPSCGKKIVVDLSTDTSQCPYCNEVFPSQSAIKSKRALPYKSEEESKTKEATLEATGFIIHDFEQSFLNSLGGNTDKFDEAPARISSTLIDSDYGKALMLKYNKKSKGGRYNIGGWCGWFTLLKKGRKYYDATSFTKLTFFVKGQNGGEHFVAMMADKKWHKVGDSPKSKDIGEYLESGKVTQKWQKAEIPFSVFPIKFKEIASVAFDFVTPGEGTVYIDNIAFE